MPKQIAVTAEMLTQIRKVSGAELDASKVAVFEAAAANLLPINKRGSIFDKARFTQTLMTEMASHINEKGIPLHTLHQQGSELPVGRVFSGAVVEGDSGPELRTQFYLDATETKLIEKLNAGSIDEVSVGVLSKHLFCSECGWDYMGEDATFDNFYEHTCANGHIIGVDGAHVVLSGLDRFHELSLVSTGAVQGAKVMPAARARLEDDGGQRRLAASGVPLDSLFLFASATKETRPMPGENFNAMALVETLATSKAELTAANTKVTELMAANTDLTGKVTALTAQLAEANAKTDEKLKTDLAAAEANAKAATEFLRDQAKKILIATGQKDVNVDAMSVADLTKTISDAQAKLASLLPVGGVTAAADSNPDDKSKVDRSAFKTRK